MFYRKWGGLPVPGRDAGVNGSMSRAGVKSTILISILLALLLLLSPAALAANLGFTSDVHGSTDNLSSWLEKLKDDVTILDHMVLGGDYEGAAVAQQCAGIVQSIYQDTPCILVRGNHDPVSPIFETGLLYEDDEYAVYVMDSAGLSFADTEISDLAVKLKQIKASKPVFVASHCPIHYFSGRYTSNADALLKVLNQHENVVFLWGHNHTVKDPYYGKVLVKGDKIITTSGGAEQAISFTYLSYGAMRDGNNGANGLLASLGKNLNGTQIDFAYRDLSGTRTSGDSIVIADLAAENHEVNYQLVSAPASGETYVIAAKSGDKYYALTTEKFTTGAIDYLEGDSITVAGDHITSNVTDDMLWKFAAHGQGFNIINDSSNYLYRKSGGSAGIYLNNNGNDAGYADWIYTDSEKSLRLDSTLVSDKFYLLLKNSGTDYYFANVKNDPGQGEIYLFKLTEGTPAETFTVTFDSKGGSAVAAITGIKKGATITLPAPPVKAEFNFAGWFTDDTTFASQFTDATPVNADLTVYAKWTAKPAETFTVTFDSQGGSAVAAITGIKKGATITLPAPPVKAEFNFAGWFTDDTTFASPFTDATPVNADLTVYAKWTAKPAETFTVTFDSKGGSAVAAITGIKKGATITLPAPPVKAEFNFDGWFTDDTTFVSPFTDATPVNADLTVYAKWTAEVVPGSGYQLVPAPASGETYAIVAKSGDKYYALTTEKFTTGTIDYLKGTNVTVSGDYIISNVTAGMLWDFTTSGQGYNIKNGANYLNRKAQASAGIYLKTQSDGSGYADWIYTAGDKSLRTDSTQVSDKFYLLLKNSGTDYYFANDKTDRGEIHLYKAATTGALTGISITQQPNKTSYIAGQSFDPAGMKVTAQYNDGTSAVVTDYSFAPAGALTTNDKKITITYQGKNADIAITVADKSLTGISITQQPNKTSYIAGQNFDPAGMKVTAQYNDGTSAVVTDYSFSPAGALTTNDKKITITYQGKNADIAITVADQSLTGISITQQPNKTSYIAGQSFDPAGMEVTAQYNDGTSAVVTGYSWAPAGALSTDDKKITLTYEGMTAEINISVTAKQVTRIKAAFEQGTTVIYTTTPLDSLKAILEVTAEFNDGSSSLLAAADYTLSGTFTEGVSTITVKYGDNEDTFTVNVTAGELTGISITQQPDRTSYIAGQSFDPAGMEATAQYNDGTSAVVTDYSWAPAGALSTDDKKITITYEGMTAEINISVTAKQVTGIKAAFEQGTTVIYTTTPLDSLKAILEVIAEFNDGSSSLLAAADYTLSGTFTEGVSTITVKYGDNEDTFTVNVAAGELTGISITQQPDKTKYTAGQSFAPAGMEVTAQFNDGSSAVVSDYSYAPKGALAITDTKITVTFGGYSADLTITVTAGSGGGGGGGGGSVPTGILVTPAGKDFSESGISLSFPAGAVNEDVFVQVKETSLTSSMTLPAGSKLISPVAAVSKDKAGDFIKPVTIGIPFDKSSIDLANYILQIYRFNDKSAQWEELEDTVVMAATGTVTGETYYTGKFAVIALPRAIAVETEPLPAAPPAPVIPADISSHWAADNIIMLINAGILSGYPDGSFQPDKTVTRAEFAVMLVKSLQLQSPSTVIFADITSHWARESIAIALAHGIVSGFDQNTFGPDHFITREQAAAMTVRAVKLPETDTELNFTDSEQIASWARSSVAAAVDSRILTGYPDRSFQPQGKLTRAEAATIIAGLL